MSSLLSTTGTNALLEELASFVPDDFLCQQWPQSTTGGRHWSFSAAQLWRLHLLGLLTPAHSVNLLLHHLPSEATYCVRWQFKKRDIRDMALDDSDLELLWNETGGLSFYCKYSIIYDPTVRRARHSDRIRRKEFMAPLIGMAISTAD